MFTGLVEAVGRVESLRGDQTGCRLDVQAPFAAELAPGDSVAVNGVCLTVVACTRAGFAADVSPVTLGATSLGSMTPGRLVNLERPVRADARMGGHFVLGHVDQTTRLSRFDPDGGAFWLEIEVPAVLEPFVIPKGSIAIDGISLTVALLEPGRVGVQVVPFTREHTALREARAGDVVNVETDVLGKYVARLLSSGRQLDSNAPVALERSLS